MRPSRSLVRRAVAAGAALALTACWPAPDQGPDKTSYNPGETRITQATVANLTESWVAPLDAPASGTPVVSVDKVHVVAGQDAYGIDIHTGARRWKTTLLHPEVPGVIPTPSPNAFVRNDELMVSMGVFTTLGGGYWTEYLDLATGELNHYEDEAAVDSVREPNSAGADVRFEGGVPMEYLTVGGPGGGQARVAWNDFNPTSRTTVGPNAVYVSGMSLVPPLVGTSGTVWDNFGLGVRAYPKALPSGCTTPGGIGFPNFTFACPTWVATLDGTRATAPVLNPSGPELYVATEGGNLYALDRADGSVLWSAALGSAGSQPALAEGRLYVDTSTAGLQVFDATGCGAATCTPEWTIAEGGTASVAGDVLYLGGNRTIRAYPADGCGDATCEPLWSADAGGATGKVVVTRGRAYVNVSGRGIVTYVLAP